MVDDHRVFILHTREPRIVAEVYHLHPSEEGKAIEIQKQFSVGSKMEMPNELILLGAVWIEPFYKGTTQQNADELAGIMRRMADWYRAYCEWEDAQHDSQ